MLAIFLQIHSLAFQLSLSDEEESILEKFIQQEIEDGPQSTGTDAFSTTRLKNCFLNHMTLEVLPYSKLQVRASPNCTSTEAL